MAAKETPSKWKDINISLLWRGTPSLLEPDRLSKILNWVSPFLSSDTEITLEANPDGLTHEWMKAYKKAGINRISLGIQSFDNPLLIKLGRNHSSDHAERAIQTVFDAGIDNLSIDLMYDLPGQTMDHWKQTLDKACQFPLKHLSLYNLTIEPHTVFHKYKKELIPQLPSEEVSLEMLNLAIDSLTIHGFKRYEISAFCKNEKWSRHNTGYWTGRPFLGLGPSAFSYWEGSRFQNACHFHRYCSKVMRQESAIEFSETLAPLARLKELLAIRLRLTEGIPLLEFSTLPLKFGIPLKNFNTMDG